MKKTIKKALIIALIYSIGIGCLFFLSWNAERVNNQNYSEPSYYEYEISNK